MDLGANPVSCQWVKQQGPAKGFDFDESKFEQIIDLLLGEKQLKLHEGHKFPTAQELQGRPYCKWHHLFTRTTNDCKELRRQIQLAIEQGRLILGQFAMKVDTRPFPGINMVEGHNQLFASVNEYDKATDLNDQLKLFLSRSLSICSDFVDDGKLGYGFTSADELEEVDIGPGDKPRATFVSKKLDPSLREPMIALLKEYSDCFACDYTEMSGLDRSIVEHRLPLKNGFWPFQQAVQVCQMDF
jgi:hypothetical protein